jgi:hypothetical protein
MREAERSNQPITFGEERSMEFLADGRHEQQ